MGRFLLPRAARCNPLILALSLLVIALFTAPANAHTRSHSYSSWVLTGAEARVTARLPGVELTRLGLGLSGRLAASEISLLGAYLSERLELVSTSGSCEISESARRTRAAPGWVAVTWALRCPPEGALTLRSSILLDEVSGHLHFARIVGPDGTVRERVLAGSQSSWELEPAHRSAGSTGGTAGTPLLGYLELGLQHILTGWDHLAFVLALLLLARSLGEVARLVTGFTLAHSVTLALAVLGWVRPEPAAVEAVIAFSVLLIAAENVWILAEGDRRVPLCIAAGLVLLTGFALAGFGVLPVLTLVGLTVFCLCHFALLARSQSPSRQRFALSFAFGLVHGFGFAGVLAEMTLPTDRLVPALFGFNIGVELGQLAVVAAVWPLLRWLGSSAKADWQRATAEIGSAAICGLGVFWLVTRSFSAG